MVLMLKVEVKKMAIKRDPFKILNLKVYPQIKPIVIASLLGVALLHSFITDGAVRAKLPKNKLDATQAHMMLEFFQDLSAGNAQPNQIEHIMEATGTGLIIQQLNLMRRATPKQYKEILTGLIRGSLPDILPIDSGERAKRGVQGLQQIWQVLQWGINNTHILKKRIDHIGING